MKRKSLGIILSGRPSYVQKGRPWSVFLEEYLPFLFYSIPVEPVLFFIIAINHKPEFSDFVRIFYGLMFSTLIVLALNIWIWGDHNRCPYCHHFVSMKRISDDKLVDSSYAYVSRNVDDYSHGTAYDLDGNLTFYTNKSSHVEWDKETTNVYTYNIRCGCCGCVTKVEKRVTKTT